MSPGKHEDCEKCEEHLAWEEKLKILDKIPGVLTDMNKLKGGIAVIIFLLPILTTIIFTNRTEMITRIKETEALVAKKQDKMADQVEKIGENTAAIRQSVAVMKTTFEMFREQNAADHVTIKRQSEYSGLKSYPTVEKENKGNR